MVKIFTQYIIRWSCCSMLLNQWLITIATQLSSLNFRLNRDLISRLCDSVYRAVIVVLFAFVTRLKSNHNALVRTNCRKNQFHANIFPWRLLLSTHLFMRVFVPFIRPFIHCMVALYSDDIEEFRCFVSNQWLVTNE